MGDLAPCLQSHKLSDIVIPGSHDSATFSLNAALAITQDKWFSGQMNYGVRQFDLRVEAQNRGITVPDYDWYAQHGTGILDQVSTWLTLKGIFTDIAAWAQMPGHEHEVVLLNLNMNGTNDVAACQWFGQQMGDALVTPSQFAGSFGTTDPGQLTLGQLWSLPDPQGYARVIIDNAQCTGDAHLDAGTWTPRSGYYADQCTAGGTGTGDQQDGIAKLVQEAVKGRFTNEAGGEPSALLPPQPGGYYVLSIQGTPEGDCLKNPADMVTNGTEAQVLQALYSQWQTDPATRMGLNVVASRFTITGAPPPALTQVSGNPPPGLTLGSDGTLTGTFPPLGTVAAATLLRGPVTYAAARATAGYRTLTLSGPRPVPAGGYTLILRHGHHAIIVPVTIR